RRAPEREVYDFSLLFIIERRKGRRFLKGRPVLVIDPEVERVVRHHPQHQPVAEHARLAEHAPHGDVAQRIELLAQELLEAVAGNHRLTLANLTPDRDFRAVTPLAAP